MRSSVVVVVVVVVRTFVLFVLVFALCYWMGNSVLGCGAERVYNNHCEMVSQ